MHSGAEWCATQKLIMVTGKPGFRGLNPVFTALGYRNTANRRLNSGLNNRCFTTQAGKKNDANESVWICRLCTDPDCSQSTKLHGSKFNE